MLSADESTVLADKEAILEWWAKHFNSVLNRPSSNRQTSTDRVQCSVRNFLPSWKQEKRFNNCNLATLQVHMQFLPRFIRLREGRGRLPLFIFGSTPMWIQKRQRDNKHDLHSKTASGETLRTEFRSIHDVCRPHKRF